MVQYYSVLFLSHLEIGHACNDVLEWGNLFKWHSRELSE